MTANAGPSIGAGGHRIDSTVSVALREVMLLAGAGVSPLIDACSLLTAYLFTLPIEAIGHPSSPTYDSQDTTLVLCVVQANCHEFARRKIAIMHLGERKLLRAHAMELDADAQAQLDRQFQQYARVFFAHATIRKDKFG